MLSVTHSYKFISIKVQTTGQTVSERGRKMTSEMEIISREDKKKNTVRQNRKGTTFLTLSINPFPNLVRVLPIVVSVALAPTTPFLFAFRSRSSVYKRSFRTFTRTFILARRRKG